MELSCGCRRIRTPAPKDRTAFETAPTPMQVRQPCMRKGPSVFTWGLIYVCRVSEYPEGGDRLAPALGRALNHHAPIVSHQIRWLVHCHRQLLRSPWVINPRRRNRTAHPSSPGGIRTHNTCDLPSLSRTPLPDLTTRLGESHRPARGPWKRTTGISGSCCSRSAHGTRTRNSQSLRLVPLPLG